MFTTVAILVGGLLLLIAGGDAFVRGASGISLRFGLSPLVVGLTVVALGTSLPEMTVSVQAALAGSGSIALGNIVGSNVANIALILGVAACIRPVQAETRVTRVDIPIVIAASGLFLLMWTDGELTRLESTLLVVLLLAFIVGQLWVGRKSPEQEKELMRASTRSYSALGRDVGFLMTGLAAIVYGGSVVVDSAIDLARIVGLSEGVIGLTIIAVGTSLPELVTSVVAALKDEGDIALGNALGSNIFNMLGIAGVTGVIHPLGMGSVAWADLWVMAALAVLLLPLARTDRSLNRWEGALLLAGYAVYTVWQVT